MSNSSDMKGTSQGNKIDQHPDFEELLKVERARMESSNKVTAPKQETEKDLGEDFDAEDDYDPEFDLEEDQPQAVKSETDGRKKNEDFSEFTEVATGPVESDDQDQGKILDDSMEFNFDDTSSPSDDAPGNADKAIKKEPVKKPSGLFTYVIIAAVVVILGGTIFYVLKHKHEAAAAAASASQQGATGFKPVLPAVQPLPQTLPPAVPQSSVSATTSTMSSNNPDDQSLSAALPNATGSTNGGITMLQLNRQQLLALLNSFQQVVTNSGSSVATEVSSLKDSITAISTSDSQLTQNMNTEFAQVVAQINQLSQKLDTYNQSMSGIQTSLQTTQQQLKLILAQRAEDITHYTLRAVVPGRVWLVDGQGKTTTLTVGDTMKDYGTVQEINDKLGTVTMSSGYVFK